MPTTPGTTPARKAVIVYGPQGCGKTHHAAALAAHFEKTTIIDDWEIGGELPNNALCLTNDAALCGVDEYRPPYSSYGAWVVQYKDAINGAAPTPMKPRQPRQPRRTYTPETTDILHSAILASVKAAIVECPIPASGDNHISARTRAFASFLSGYLECSTPDLAEAIFSLFKKAQA